MVNGDGDGEAIHSLCLFFKDTQIYLLALDRKHEYYLYKMHKIALTKSIKLIAGNRAVPSLYQIAVSIVSDIHFKTCKQCG